MKVGKKRVLAGLLFDRRLKEEECSTVLLL